MQQNEATASSAVEPPMLYLITYDDYNDDGDDDAVPLPRLLPEQQDGGAGQEAGEQAVERAALAEALSTLVNLTEAAAGAAQADLAVTTAVEEALLPSCFR